MQVTEQLKELRLSATESCKFRGHRMIWSNTDFRRKGRTTQDAQCFDCHMDVRIDTAPPPNGIDIGGQAVALDCDN